MREPTRKFLASNGRIVSQPLRELPVVADEPEVVDRIRGATRLCDEPEVPSKATVDAVSDLGRTFDKLRHAREVEAREQIRAALMHDLGSSIAIEHRMADAQRRAKRQHVDISHEIHICRKMLDRARNGGRDA